MCQNCQILRNYFYEIIIFRQKVPKGCCHVIAIFVIILFSFLTCNQILLICVVDDLHIVLNHDIHDCSFSHHHVSLSHLLALPNKARILCLDSL
jgi:hypothetical protein